MTVASQGLASMELATAQLSVPILVEGLQDHVLLVLESAACVRCECSKFKYCLQGNLESTFKKNLLGVFSKVLKNDLRTFK